MVYTKTRIILSSSLFLIKVLTADPPPYCFLCNITTIFPSKMPEPRWYFAGEGESERDKEIHVFSLNSHQEKLILLTSYPPCLFFSSLTLTRGGGGGLCCKRSLMILIIFFFFTSPLKVFL